VAGPCVSLGLALSAAGRAGEALPHFQRALAIQERALKPQHPSLAVALMGLGEAQGRLGRSAEAAATLERALRIREAARVPALELAATRFALAQVLWQRGGEAHRARSRALVEEVQRGLDTLAEDAAGRSPLRAQVQAWREAHPAG
jgi:eukaryotic-like serine/threonine-protein kinase